MFDLFLVTKQQASNVESRPADVGQFNASTQADEQFGAVAGFQIFYLA
jgi:hypothetical protein